MNFAASRSLILSAVAAVLISACGGGAGDADMSGNNSAVTSSASAVPSAVATSVSINASGSAPLSVGNVAADGRNWINYRRAQIGMSMLIESPLVDRAAQSHSDYQRMNNTISHSEESNAWGYTGADEGQRLAKAGVSLPATGYAYGEVISSTTNSSGFFMAEELVTAIYHRFVIFQPVFKEIGTGSATSERNYTYFTADFLANNGYGPGLGLGQLRNWPINGQTGVQPNFFSDQEDPDPVDKINEVGYPVSVHGDLGTVIAISKFSIKPRNGSELNVKLLQNATDARTPASAAAIIPLAPLSAGTTYDVVFTGSSSGVPVSLSWSFTTK